MNAVVARAAAKCYLLIFGCENRGLGAKRNLILPSTLRNRSMSREVATAMSAEVTSLLSDLMETLAFRRLRHVSFLGVVDSFVSASGGYRHRSSRAEHSLGVLRIGAKIASFLSLPQEEAIYLMTACLVHDLGHPPFSHSLEYAYPRPERTFDHHKILKEILTSPLGNERQVSRVMEKHGISAERVFSIVDGSDALSYFFYSPINIDTIDGISRSIWSFGLRPSYDVNMLIGFVARVYRGDNLSGDQSIRHADLFWRDKAEFYKFLGSQNSVAAAERKFQSVVRRHIPILERGHFRLTDSEFTLRYPQVFAEIPDTEDYLPVAIQQDFFIDSSVLTVNRDTVRSRYARVRHEVRGLGQPVSKYHQSTGKVRHSAIAHS